MDFESYLIGKLSALEDKFKTDAAAAAVTETPAPELTLAERWQQEQAAKAQADKDFLDHLAERAGVKQPAPATAAPEAPATLSRSSPRYARDFAKYADAIADGRTTIVD